MKIPERLLQKIRPSVAPFERKNFQFEIKENEDLLISSIKIDSSTLPFSVKVLSLTDINENRKAKSLEGKYLWIIDEENGLRVVEENTPVSSARGVACHTNITGGKKALQGGELWFSTNKTVCINYKSGRYGAVTSDEFQEIQEQGVIEYFEYLGFKVELAL